jgi:tetrapyrrole methylase family protein / MazG family protein
MITIVGLGPGPEDLLSGGARSALFSVPRVLLRTEHHPLVGVLRAAGVAFEPLDHLTASTSSHAELADALTQRVLSAARGGENVVYAVPGSPLVAERSVELLLLRASLEGVQTRVVPSVSFVDVTLAVLADGGELLSSARFELVDARDLDDRTPDLLAPTLIHQVDSIEAARRVRSALSSELPDDWPVVVVRAAGLPEQERRVVDLGSLDQSEAELFTGRTTLYVAPPGQRRRRRRFEDLVAVMARLRAPDGCPWDREQTYETLRRYVLEEAYEVVEAIDGAHLERLPSELGDLLLQVVFQAEIAREEGRFDIRDVITEIVDKLVRRHPHVFADVAVSGSDEVLRNWEQIKSEEYAERGSVLDGVPPALPALMKALEVSKRAVRVGFEWPDLNSLLEKVDEEWAEFRQELRQGDPARTRDELGDLLFTLVNIARWLKVDPEEALRTMVARFSDRFRRMERVAADSGRPLNLMVISEMDALWEQAKDEASAAPRRG